MPQHPPFSRNSLAHSVAQTMRAHPVKCLQATLLALAGSMMSAPVLSQETINGTAETVIGTGGGTQSSPWAISGDLTVGNTLTGSLAISAGGLVSNAFGFIGYNPGSTGTVTVSGAGSKWTNQNYLAVGNFGNGTLAITNGAEVSNTDGVIGWRTGSTGAVTVSGTGSKWTNQGELNVGYGGNGTLAISDGAEVINTTGYIGSTSGSGTVTVSGAGSKWTNSGVLYVGRAGNGTLTLATGGVVTAPIITIANSVSGTVTGTLNIGAAAGSPAVAPGTLNTPSLVFGPGTGTLVFNHTDPAYAFAPLISGTAGNINVHSGTTILTANNTYTGNTTIYGGTLAVNGTLPGDIQVNGGGRLQGSGTVGNVTLASGGVIAPGNSIGTQTINGTLTFAPGSIYQVEVDPASSSSDRIQVNGVANLAGQVQHVGMAGTYQPNSRYTILNATGGFAGTTFAGVTSNFAFLTPSLAYDSTNVFLDLMRNSVAVAALAQTPNQAATGGALDTLPIGGALANAILTLSPAQVPGTLDALSGEIHASAAGAVLQNSQAFSNGLLQRTGSLLGERKPEALPLWVEASGSNRTNSSDGNAARATQSGGTFALGGELPVSDDWTLGGAFQYGDHRLSVDDRNSNADLKGYSFGLYGRYLVPAGEGKLHLTLGGTYGWHSIDTRRTITSPGLQQSLSADYNATSGQLFGEAGYALAVSPVAHLEPYANLIWTQVKSDNFSESGGNAALHGETNNDVAATTLGLRGRLALPDARFNLLAGLGWMHVYGDINPQAELSFAGTSSFVIDGAPFGRNTALLDLAASYQMTPATRLRVGYNGQYGDSVTSNLGYVLLNVDL